MEQLIEKWDMYQRTAKRMTKQEEFEEETRWWMNAIADELTMNLNSPMGCQDVTDWLKGEAKEEIK